MKQTTRELAEAGGPIPSCPVDRRACLREICDVFGERTGWACYHIALEIQRRDTSTSRLADR